MDHTCDDDDAWGTTKALLLSVRVCGNNSYRRRVARLRAVVVVQRKLRQTIRSRATFRITGLIGRLKRTAAARRVQRAYVYE